MADQGAHEQEEGAAGPFALSSSVMETSAEGAAKGLASIQKGLELEGLGEVRGDGGTGIGDVDVN